MNELLFTRGQLWPWLFLLPVVWAGLWLLLRTSRVAALRYGATITDPVPAPLWRSLSLTVLCGLALLTWMDPRQGEEAVAVEKRGLDLIFCLDTSRSMLARDLEPTRLLRAKQDMKSVLPALAGGDRIALVVFAGEAKLWVPLTHDLDSFRQLLDEVDTNVVPVGGSDVAAALRKARELADPEHDKTTAVVLLTDGEDLAGAGRQAGLELAGAGIHVHTVGYGSTYGSKITLQEDGKESFLRSRSGEEVVSVMDAESLRAIAQATGGEFVRADAMALPLRQLYDKRLAPLVKRSYDAGEEKAHKARYQWVLLPTLVLLLLEIVVCGGRRR